jgi:hypothetical protein
MGMLCSESNEFTKKVAVNQRESFCSSLYADQMRMEECELSSFIRAVTELFGPTQVKLSVAYWLDEAELMDCPPLSISRDWRAVSIAASARLANPMTVELLNHDEATCNRSVTSRRG